MSRLWVQLCRNGDLLNILPLLWSDAQKGERPKLMVASEYAPLLEGVSYVEPVIFEGKPFELKEAFSKAVEIDEDFICTQVNGPTDLVRDLVYARAKQTQAMTTCYQKEMWKIAGRFGEWGSQVDRPQAQWPLVFDNRNPEREAELLKTVKFGKRKTILVCADGISSPFIYKPLLFELLKLCGYAVIDLATVKAERLFDLLALYEKAAALIAIDSAPLHLAAVVPELPVFALIQDKPLPWSGSAWKAQHVWYCRYSDFPLRAVEMLEALKGIKRIDYNETRVVRADTFTVSRFGPSKEDQRPFVKDLLKMAIQSAAPSGWVTMTKPGIQFHSSPDPLVLEQPCFAYRLKNDKDGHKQWSSHIDFFCAKATWWHKLLPDIPELFLNNDYYWTEALFTFFKKAGAKDITGYCHRLYSESQTKEEISPSTKRNMDGNRAAVLHNKHTCRYPKVSEQVESYPLDKSSLFPFAYNPTIIAGEEGFRIMAYRYHPKLEDSRTQVALAQLDDTGKAMTNKALELYEAAEDPKLFQGPRWPFLSFVCSQYPKYLKSIVRYAEVVGGKVQGIVTPGIGHNDWTAVEKNWCFWFEQRHSEALRILYQTSPEQIIYGQSKEPWVVPGPRWPYGQPRGGTAPLEYDQNLIRFFHSSVRTEYTGSRHRYFIGAYLMRKEPPYDVVAVSRKPILYGSEIDDIKVKDRPPHWKSNIVFCSGAIAENGGFTLALGINDSACMLAKITPKELNL